MFRSVNISFIENIYKGWAGQYISLERLIIGKAETKFSWASAMKLWAYVCNHLFHPSRIMAFVNVQANCFGPFVLMLILWH